MARKANSSGKNIRWFHKSISGGEGLEKGGGPGIFHQSITKSYSPTKNGGKRSGKVKC